jgi:arylsulfatase A-like enzyme
MTRLLIFLFASATFVIAAAPPNVLFIAMDDLRPDLRCYGESHMVTPHMDSLASQGRMFRNHYVAVPTCGASRYAMMTGLRPTAATDGNNAFETQMPTTLPAQPESWVDLLRRNGWRTVSLGKISHEPDGHRWNAPGNGDLGRSSVRDAEMRFSWNEILYDHEKWGAESNPLYAYANGSGRTIGISPAWEIGVRSDGQSLPDEAYPDGQMTQAAIGKLREFADDGSRFCLAVGFLKPHLPFNAPKAYWDLYNPSTLPGASPTVLPTGANTATTTSSGEINQYTQQTDRARLRHAYFACISYVDAQIGKLLAELNALGLANNTIVVIWGDHGFRLNDYGTMGKHAVLERALESPLIIRPPTSVRSEVFAGIPAQGVVETIDIYPTIAELCGLNPPASAVGSSLVPMLRNPYSPGKNHAFSRFDSTTTIRTPNWRLIDTNGDRDLYNLSFFRYEVADVSGSNSSVLATLSANLGIQGSRPSFSYAEWVAGDSRITDPNGDGDGDGISNFIEYAAGSNPLDRADRPKTDLSVTNLSNMGFGANESVFRFELRTDRDDISLLPSTLTDLINWTSQPMNFLDAVRIDSSYYLFRFRAPRESAPRRFFRLDSSP